MPSVRLTNVTKRYGEITAVENINLQVKDREYVCIIGPSGCGKTTLIKCISGIIQPSEGEIYIDDKLVKDVPIQDRGIGYVFQEIALFPHMNIYDNVSYGPAVKGWEITKTRRLVGEMLSMMKLQNRIEDYPDELSGGARQKTAIARALSSGSLLLLLDEPLGSLDAKVRAVLRHELRRMVKDLNLTAIHVTHNQEEAMAISDRIVVMKAGKIIEVGSPFDLYLHPKRPFTANFVGEANFLVGEVEELSNEKTVVKVQGEVLIGKRLNLGEGKIVAVIRPEFVVMQKFSRRKESWKGRVENKTFIGSAVRYEIRTDNGELIAAKQPFEPNGSKFEVGSRVSLTFPPQHVLLYPYPEEGLEREISIE